MRKTDSFKGGTSGPLSDVRHRRKSHTFAVPAFKHDMAYSYSCDIELCEESVNFRCELLRRSQDEYHSAASLMCRTPSHSLDQRRSIQAEAIGRYQTLQCISLKR
jgi:hypothetical protein